MKTIFKIIFYFTLTVLFSNSVFADRVLVLGDSHTCGAFGSELVKRIVNQGHTVERYCTPSSKVNHWVQGYLPQNHFCQSSDGLNSLTLCNDSGEIPLLSQISDKLNPDRVIIALGTNSLGVKKIDVQEYQTLIDKLSNSKSKCFWIGPPHLNPVQAEEDDRDRLMELEGRIDLYYKSLRSALAGKCKLIDNRKMTEVNAGAGQTTDGIHRGKTAGSAWATAIMKEIN